MNLLVRRITIAFLAAFLMGAVLVVPATSASGPQAAASKKAKKKKCKKKKGKKGKKAKKCKSGGGSTSVSGLPGQATPSSPTQPDTPVVLHVASLGVSASTVLAGNSTTGSVTIDQVAPAAGQRVDLQSDSSRVTVPGSVVVAPGQTSAGFTVDTSAGGPVTATLTGSIGGSNANTIVNVVDHASVSSVKLERQCFTFGPFSSNRVSLDVPAPSDTLVSLASDSAGLTVPAGVTVPSGSSSAFFSVNAVADAATATVTATLGTSNASDTAQVSSTDPDANVASLTLNPDRVSAGNGTLGTVTLDCEAPEGGVTVTLSADDGIGVPTQVTVPEGALSATFQVSTQANIDDGPYVISATNGGEPKQATLTLDSTLPT